MKWRFVFIVIIFLSFKSGFSQDAVDDNNVIRVLSFNILHGATTKGDFNLDIIAQVIKDADPDFVALQEVDFKTKRAKGMDLVTELGWRTGMQAIFGRAMIYDGGEYGEGILSKYSFIKTRNVPLPHLPGSEPRAALEVITVLPSGDTISFIGTHLDHQQNEEDRIMQSKMINDVFSWNHYPTILAGDLNATPQSTPINILSEIWTASFDHNKIRSTYPSDNPSKKIDYVLFLKKNNWVVHSTREICDTVASDHCAYLVTLELKNE